MEKCKPDIMHLNVFNERWVSVRELNIKLFLETVIYITV